MNRKVLIIVALLALVGSMAFAQDLKIDWQLKLGAADAGNFFSFTGKYISVDKDGLDATTGASKKLSTELFQSYRVDPKGAQTLPGGLRSLFLFALSGADQQVTDQLNASKAADGTITIQYVHRGTAYRLITDKNGMLTLPAANATKRAVGYISGSNPQVISTDFSADKTAAKINWSKVWSTAVAGGKVVTEGNAKKTGDIEPDVALATSMYYWDGSLQVTLVGGVLKIAGGLNAVKR